MRAIIVLVQIFVLALWATPSTAEPNMVCYYDSSSNERTAIGQLNFAVQFCTHLVYGYAGIASDTYEITSLLKNVDIQNKQISEIKALKRRYPRLKVLLSVGGDKDGDPHPANKYMKLLESDRTRQSVFINSARKILKNYGFDGLDLAFQFPKNKARKVHSKSCLWCKKVKKGFTGDHVVDEKAEEHKNQFTNFVRNIHNIMQLQNLILTLTVLPNVNSTWYFDIPTISPYFDFVNLAAFDFVTPERNPEEADFTAPTYKLYGQNRLDHYNLDFQVNYWLQHKCPANKINVGIATYGRAWKMTTDSGTTGIPVIPCTHGPAPAGPLTHKAGLLSLREICDKLPNRINKALKGANAPLRSATDPTRRYGTYAYRPADKKGLHGIWVSYEDAESAANKAVYVRSKELGGMAIFDLSFDDFQGKCTGIRFPILRGAKFYLL